jgi:hydrocephalus-inducing protein
LQVIHFSTHVRTRETRSIVLNNRSNLLWQLRPKIDGAYWSGADMITVDPQQSKNYDLTYRPLVMTHEGKRHTVSDVVSADKQEEIACLTSSTFVI